MTLGDRKEPGRRGAASAPNGRRDATSRPLRARRGRGTHYSGFILRGRCVGATSNGEGTGHQLVSFTATSRSHKQHKMQPTDFFGFTTEFFVYQRLPAKCSGLKTPLAPLKTLTPPPPARSPRRPAQSPARLPPSSPAATTRTTSRTRNQPPRRTQERPRKRARTGSNQPAHQTILRRVRALVHALHALGDVVPAVHLGHALVYGDRVDRGPLEPFGRPLGALENRPG